MAVTATIFASCGGAKTTTAEADKFDYTVEQFADLQILRYKVPEFETLTLKQKELVYYLTQAALEGRDILFDQNGKYNLRIRRMLEAIIRETSRLPTSKIWKCTSNGYGSPMVFIIITAWKSLCPVSRRTS